MKEERQKKPRRVWEQDERELEQQNNRKEGKGEDFEGSFESGEMAEDDVMKEEREENKGKEKWTRIRPKRTKTK